MLFLPVLATPAAAACPDDAAVAAFARDFVADRKTAGLAADGTLDNATCARDKLVTVLAAELGPKVGYKLAFTSAATQEQFGVDAPVHGVLFRDMLLEDGARRPAASTLWEADLVAVVGDDGIMAATTPEEVVQHLSAVRPFIELPSVAYDPVTALTVTAANAGARRGVLGPAVPVETAAAFAQSLADMRVVVTDQTGAELATAEGSSILGNPLEAILVLIDQLDAAETGLEPGALISLGSLTPLTPAKPGQTITVRYEGLPGTPEVSVGFD